MSAPDSPGFPLPADAGTEGRGPGPVAQGCEACCSGLCAAAVAVQLLPLSQCSSLYKIQVTTEGRRVNQRRLGLG